MALCLFAVGAPGLLLAVVYPFFVRDYQVPNLHEGRHFQRVWETTLRLSQIVKEVLPPGPATSRLSPSVCKWGIPGDPDCMGAHFLQPVLWTGSEEGGFDGSRGRALGGYRHALWGRDRRSVEPGKTARYRAIVPAAYALISGLMLAAAFALPPGLAGLALFIGGALFAAAHGGSAVAMLIDVTNPAVHATVTATAVLGASLLGMAPGPYLVGMLSDVANLKTALSVAPLMSDRRGGHVPSCLAPLRRRHRQASAGA